VPNEIKLRNVGSVLRGLREEANLSLREAAAKLGWNHGELSKFETDKVGVSLEIVEKIADVVGMPREAVILRCLQARYRSLAGKDTPIGKALGRLLNEIDKHAG
jgi:transcriptional regulator with XRE-family HTH domain